MSGQESDEGSRNFEPGWYQDTREPTYTDWQVYNRPGTAKVSPHIYQIQPFLPARRVEIRDSRQATFDEQYASRIQEIFDPEKEAAIQAIESGIYIGWRLPGSRHDCIRVSSESLCFCGHRLNQHERIDKNKAPNLKCQILRCPCKHFSFIPSRPDEIGEWWLHKRRGFDVSSWRAMCRCKHSHERHEPTFNKRCTMQYCSCFAFSSNFLCAACDKHWEAHETCFDDLASRKAKGLPYGEDFLPFAEVPQLRNVVLTGREDDNSAYAAIQGGPHAIPREDPTPLTVQLRGKGPQPGFRNIEEHFSRG